MQTADDRRLRARQADDMVVLYGSDGLPAAVRGPVERNLGYSPDELLALRLGDIVHPADLDRFHALRPLASATPGTEHRVEVRLRRSGGSWCRVEIGATDLRDDERVQAFLVCLRDLSHRARPLRPLEATEENVRALLRNSRDAYVIIDGDGCLTWVSDQISEMLGYSLDDAAGINLFDVVHPEDAAAARLHVRDLLSGRERSEPVPVRIPNREGSFVWVEGLASVLIDDDGGLEGVLINVRDLSWRQDAEEAVRQTEERFRALVQNSADVVIVVDQSGVVSYASPGLERLFGWSPVEVERGSCLDFIAAEDHEAVAAALNELATRGPEDPFTGLFRVVSPRGGWRWAEVIAVNHLTNPAVRGIVANVRDVSERLDAESALRASEARFRAVVSQSYDVTAVLDAEGTIRWVTPNCETLLGHRPSDLVGTPGLDLIHPDFHEHMAAELAAFVAGEGVPNPTPVRMRTADNSWRDVEIVGSDFLHHPDIGGIAVNLRDIGDRVAGDRERERLTEIFEMTSDLVGIAAAGGKVVYLNDAAREFLEVPPGTPVDQVDLSQALPRTNLSQLFGGVVSDFESSGIWTGEIDLLRRDRSVVPHQVQVLGHRDTQGRIEYVSAILRDISERRSFEVRLRHEATHDPLTGLPNRTLLLDRLEGALKRSRRHGTAVGVLFCDLDNFKVVNDSLGHSYGDLVLTEAARRLQDQLRPGDTVSRFGGDEFVILCEDCLDVEDAVRIAKRVDEAMAEAFEIGGSEVYVGVSVGIAIDGPVTDPAEPAADPEALIRDADAAMYRAKERGRGRYQVFEPGIWARALDRFDLENALRRAVSRGELDVLYQPVVALGDGDRIVGVEALVRWDHPQRGRLLPGDFIHLAEDTGLVLGLGEWVLGAACCQLARWMERFPDLGHFTLAVNLSGRQLEHPDLVGIVAAAIDTCGIPADRLDLEVTESVLMDDVELSAATLSTLKRLGVKISVDDFGTGYSSLAYLRKFPVDRLKVDRSFVDGLGSEPEDSAIAAAIVNLAHTLGLVAVGEGVETLAQLTALRSLGCDLAQGYYFGEPMTGDELAERLQAQQDS